MPIISSRARRLTCAATAAGVLCATLVSGATAASGRPAHAKPGKPTDASITVEAIGSHATGVFDSSAAEIPAFDPTTNTLFVVNAQSGQIDVLRVNAKGIPTKRGTLSASGNRVADGSTVGDGAVVNSVAVARGILAVAVEHDDKVQPGWVLFYATKSLTYLGGVRVGSLPDSLAFAPGGGYVVVANEGEPADDFGTDPEGTISVISVPSSQKKFSRLSQKSVRTVDFRAYDKGKRLPAGVRVFGPDVAVPAGQRPAGYVARNLEPEYVTISRSGRTAYVSIQEANAVAVVDIAKAKLTNLWSMEPTDWSVDGTLDVSDEDGSINRQHWPVMGVPMPDGIATYRGRGQDLIVTANEGDSREWGDFVDAARVGNKAVPLCAEAFPDGDALKEKPNLGRLNIITDLGFSDEKGCYNRLFAFGSRSFSIYTAGGTRLFDSAGQFEETIERLIDTGRLDASAFNANHSEQPSFDKRSDDKGPEPEGVAVGEVHGRTYAFIGLERVGGVMIYDITNPRKVSFVDYVNNRDFTPVFSSAADAWQPAGDLGPEGLTFIPKRDSPTRTALLVVASEVSGTTTVFEVAPTRR